LKGTKILFWDLNFFVTPNAGYNQGHGVEKSRVFETFSSLQVHVGYKRSDMITYAKIKNFGRLIFEHFLSHFGQNKHELV